MKAASAPRLLQLDKAWTELSSLPVETQREVLDFIAFLRARRTRAPTRKATRRRKLVAETFIGMWRSRQDMRDSTAWVRRAREEEWVRHRG